MRAGFSPALEQRLRRPDPTAGLLVDAEVIAAEALKQTRAQWEGADSLTGLTVFDDGAVQLAGTGDTLVNLTGGSDVTMTALRHPLGTSPWSVAALDFGSPGARDRVITAIEAHLDPTADGGQPQDVVQWACQLWSLFEQDNQAGVGIGLGPRLRLRPITGVKYVAAVAAVQNIVFSFADRPPTPGQIIPRDRHGGAPPNDGVPRCYVRIWALKADGTPAGNVAWVTDDAQSSGGANGITVRHRSLALSAVAPGLYTDGSGTGLPRIRIDSKTYAQATIAFTGAGNQLDLGATPTEDVIFAVAGETPAGTSITAEVRNDADTAWVPFTDGQLVDGLAGVTKRQTYTVRATLTPSSGGAQTPTLRLLGARRTTRVEIPRELVQIEGGRWAFDPPTLKAEIPEIAFRVLRDGQRDFRDLISELLSDHHLGEVRFRFWWGDRDRARSEWLHVEDVLIDDVEDGGAALRIVAVSEYAQLRQILPVPKIEGADVVRDPLTYAQQSLKAVWDDLLDNQVGLAGRLKGPGIEDTTTTTSKVITDSEVKPELDAIAFLAGGIATSRQGRLSFVAIHGQPKVPVAVFAAEDIRVLNATPGFRARIAEYFVPFNYDFEERRFRDEARTFHGPALTKLGKALIESEPLLDDAIAQWVITQSGDASGESSLAETVGERQILTMGTGLLQIDFVSAYPYPELFLGDPVAVQVDRLVLRDPNLDLAIRGELWALGVLRAVDIHARTFSVWVQALTDLFQDVEYVLRDEYQAPELEHFIEPVLGNPGKVRVRIAIRPAGATIKYLIQDAGATIPAVGDASYQTYLQPFIIDRLDAQDRQLTYYGENGALRSRRHTVTIDKDTAPEATLTLSEPVAGTLRVTWTPDDDVVFVHVYRKKNGAGNGWPTTNNEVDGTLDEAELVGRIHVSPDGSASDRTGAPLTGMTGGTGVGGTTWEETGYATNDVAKVILVPFDRAGNAGTRASASLTLAGSASPAIDGFSASKNADGSSCASPWTVDLVGNVNPQVTDVDHDMVYSYRRDGGGWTVLFTDTTPATNDGLTQTKDMESFVDAAGDSHSYDFKAELVPAGGGTPLDTKVTSKALTLKLDPSCPLG